MKAIYLIVLILPYVAFAVLRARSWLKRRRAAAEWLKRRPIIVGGGAGVIFRNFSVYADGTKLGTAQSHAFRLTADETTLTVNQLVPGEIEHGGSAILRRAFQTSEKVQIGVGPIDGETLNFGEMTVTEVTYSTDCKTGITRLTASLRGASLKTTKTPATISVPFVEQKAFVYPAVDGSKLELEHPQ